jgi:hypothetical protein
MQRLANGHSAGAPPVTRILFGPTGSRARERLVVLRSGSDNLAGVVYDKCAGAAGSNVDAEIRDTPSSKCPVKARSQRVRRLGEVFRKFAIRFAGLLLCFRFD